MSNSREYTLMALTQQQTMEALEAILDKSDMSSLLLEAILDKSDMSSLLLALGRVCNDKAEHLRYNWQDEITAKVWDRMATKLDKLAIDSTTETISKSSGWTLPSGISTTGRVTTNKP